MPTSGDDYPVRLTDLEYMTLLMIDTMEHTLESTAEITGHSEWYYIPDQQANMLLFSAYHLLQLIKAMSTQFHEDLHQ